MSEDIIGFIDEDENSGYGEIVIAYRFDENGNVSIIDTVQIGDQEYTLPDFLSQYLYQIEQLNELIKFEEKMMMYLKDEETEEKP